MTKPRLRRWHFDLALLAGILVLAASYWFIGPRPRWQTRILTDPTIKMHVSALGFSQDEQFYYTLKDDYLLGNRKPKPMIQRWEAKTGELLEEYALKLPATDIAQWRSLPPGAQDYAVYPLVLPENNLIQIFQSIDRQASLDSYRLFDITTGECITNNPPTVVGCSLIYLKQDPQNGHHWGCFQENGQPGKPVQLIDLNDGNIIKSFRPPEGATWCNAAVLWNQEKLILAWHSTAEESRGNTSLLTIHPLDTWECLQQMTLPVQPAAIRQIVENGENQFEIKYLRGVGNLMLTTARYRYDIESKKYAPVLPVTTEDYQGNETGWYHNSLVRIHRKTIRNTSKPHPLVLTMNSFLERYGISLGRIREEDQISVYDAKTGSLLRKLTGLPELGGGSQISTISSHWVVHLNADKGCNTLTLYEIPHYLWHPTMQGVMYLSWLLVIPWPFRYLIRSAR